MHRRAPRYLEENALNAELYARWNKGERDILRAARLVTIHAPETVARSGFILGWQPVEFPYPAVLKPLAQLNPLIASGQSGKLFAFLGERPDNPPNGGTYAIESRNGLLQIPIPGQWWIFYDGIVDTEVQCMVFDDTCGAAQHLLDVRNTVIREPGVVNVLTAAATDIVTDDPYRDGVILQNQGTVDVWVRKGTAAGNPAAVGSGYKIPAGESLPLVDAIAYKGPLNGRADGVNCNVWPWDFAS